MPRSLVKPGSSIALWGCRMNGFGQRHSWSPESPFDVLTLKTATLTGILPYFSDSSNPTTTTSSSSSSGYSNGSKAYLVAYVQRNPDATARAAVDAKHTPNITNNSNKNINAASAEEDVFVLCCVSSTHCHASIDLIFTSPVTFSVVEAVEATALARGRKRLLASRNEKKSSEEFVVNLVGQRLKAAQGNLVLSERDGEDAELSEDKDEYDSDDSFLASNDELDGRSDSSGSSSTNSDDSSFSLEQKKCSKKRKSFGIENNVQNLPKRSRIVSSSSSDDNDDDTSPAPSNPLLMKSPTSVKIETPRSAAEAAALASTSSSNSSSSSSTSSSDSDSDQVKSPREKIELSMYNEGPPTAAQLSSPSIINSKDIKGVSKSKTKSRASQAQPTSPEGKVIKGVSKSKTKSRASQAQPTSPEGKVIKGISKSKTKSRASQAQPTSLEGKVIKGISKSKTKSRASQAQPTSPEGKVIKGVSKSKTKSRASQAQPTSSEGKDIKGISKSKTKSSASLLEAASMSQCSHCTKKVRTSGLFDHMKSKHSK